MAIETPKSLLDFWIGPAKDDPDAAKAKGKLWFTKSFQTDREIAERFLPTLSALASGMAYEWAVASPEGRLAAIIGLDQFSRNIFRDTPDAFANDAVAVDLATHGILLAVDMEMAEVERQFFYLPLEHSESAADQALCVKAFTGAVRSAREPFKAHMQDALDWAVKHKEVIDRFGRFPHRNTILGRVSSPEEDAWIRENGGF
ncbi:MAG: DUF924 family protein [Pseudomonadota bacterium]